MGEVGIDRSIVVPMPYHVTMGEIRDFRLQKDKKIILSLVITPEKYTSARLAFDVQDNLLPPEASMLKQWIYPSTSCKPAS